jgi:ribose transport system permease protein
LNLNAVPTSWQNIVLGVIILLAVFIDMWRADFGRLLGKAWSRVAGRASTSVDSAGDEKEIGPPPSRG